MFNPLSGWIKRNHPIPSRFYTPGVVDQPDRDWNVWLSIEEVAPLHEVSNMQWLSLKDARYLTKNYLEEASELINGLEGGWLDREEQQWILEEIGGPPIPSLPIYLISCRIDESETLVYVGKTKNTSRFSGGHAAALKLNDPKYAGMEKFVYRATAWFYLDDEYIALDWIEPEEIALDLLDNIESQLIFYLQPELNTSKKKKNCTHWDFGIHIQNFLGGGFLNDTFL